MTCDELVNAFLYSLLLASLKSVLSTEDLLRRCLVIFYSTVCSRFYGPVMTTFPSHCLAYLHAVCAH